MRTDDFRPSDNVEDDREVSASRGGISGGGIGGLGIGTVIIIGLVSWYFGIDPSVLLNGAQILTGGSPSEQTSPAPTVPRGRRPTRPASSSRLCSATPRIAGRKFSPPADKPIIRRSCVCSRAPSRRLARSRSRPWDRSTARATSASISTPRSSTICSTSSAAVRTATPASFPRPT